MAGMRIGYAMGNAKLIRYINDVKYSFNSYTMNRTALALGVEAIRDRAYFEETRKKIIETREWTKKRAAGVRFYVRGFDEQFYLCFARARAGNRTVRGAAQGAYLCASFYQGTHQQLPAHQHRNERRDGDVYSVPEGISERGIADARPAV